jgi:hypothetical protein
MSQNKDSSTPNQKSKTVVKSYTAGTYRVVNKESVKLYNPNVISVKKRTISA